METSLELRMYGLVIYNASPIQQAIQFGHAVVDYGLEHFNTAQYQEWAHKYKTFIILSGGTTNENSQRLGTLQMHKQAFDEAGIVNVGFKEPDLNDAMTAFTFIVDERVFNRRKYPDFNDYVKLSKDIRYRGFGWVETDLPNFDLYKLIEADLSVGGTGYKAWVKFVGGEKNAFLRDYLKQFKLA